MRDIGPATEADMILAFLRAEVDSPRFGTAVREVLGGNLALVSQRADVMSISENAQRRAALTRYRGFGNNTLLFRGFPASVGWRRVVLNCDDLSSLMYANTDAWRELSNNSRLVGDGARYVGKFPVSEDVHLHIPEVERELSKGRTYPELILLAEGPDTQHYVVEGHTRVTAYARNCDESSEYETIVGYARSLGGWAFL